MRSLKYLLVHVVHSAFLLLHVRAEFYITDCIVQMYHSRIDSSLFESEKVRKINGSVLSAYQ